MAKKTFQGRPVVAGDLNGKATVSKQPFNTTASYMENVWAGNTKNAPCTDQDNKDLFKKDLAGIILCTSQCIGSSMGWWLLHGRGRFGLGSQSKCSFHDTSIR